MFVVCPACGHTYPITESKGEARLHCEKCKASFFVELDDAPASPAPAPPQPVTPPATTPAPNRTVTATSAAMIHCSCPRCRRPLEAPASWAGQKMTCSGCGQRLQLPAASPPAVAAPNRTVLAESMPAPPPGPARIATPAFASQPAPAFHAGPATTTMELPQAAAGFVAPSKRSNMGLMLGLVIGGGLLFVGALVVLLIVFNSGGGGGRGSNPLMGKWESVGTPQTVRLDINATRMTMSAEVVVNLGYRVVDGSNLDIVFDDTTVAELERTYSKTLSPEERAGLLKTVRMTYQLEGDSLTVRDPTGEVRYRRAR